MPKFKIGQINKALREVQKDLMLGTIPAAAFDMATSGTERCGIKGEFCGTVACIGGHAALKLDTNTSNFVSEADPDFEIWSGEKRETMSAKTAKVLSPLFYPLNAEDTDWSKLTPAQAVLAIENYFNHKSNPWKGVIV